MVFYIIAFADKEGGEEAAKGRVRGRFQAQQAGRDVSQIHDVKVSLRSLSHIDTLFIMIASDFRSKRRSSSWVRSTSWWLWARLPRNWTCSSTPRARKWSELQWTLAERSSCLNPVIRKVSERCILACRVLSTISVSIQTSINLFLTQCRSFLTVEYLDYIKNFEWRE